METKLDKKRMEKVRKRCGFANGIEVEAECSRGGLCMAWKKEISVNLKSYSRWHIDVLIKEDNVEEEWRYTGFYSSPYLKDKNTVWNLLRRLAQESDFPWLVEGDFNKILYSFEKCGGIPRDNRRMEAFRETLVDCQLFDIGKFHFEAWWTMEESLEKVIRESWEANVEGERNDDTLAKLIDTKIHLNLEIDKNEMYWEHRARQNWLKLGDKNTAYFHRCALAWWQTNTISKLVTEEGAEIEEESEILSAASSFFQNLFKSKGVADPCKVLDGIERTIKQEDNEFLLAPYREEEIQAALEGMGPTKAPKADGFPALFYQKYWHIVGRDVTEFCLGILNNNQDFGGFNSTNIILIPKVPKPTQLVNFRPISLCTFIYKVVAKTIANRLQKIIDKCIDKVQSAFVPGRLITDNVLLAYEIFHTINQKRTGKKGVMAVKLDMSKAYDRVEWGFIEEVMKKMGFDCKWVELLRRCVTTVSYAVNINGRRGNLFLPSRGLRQGDPLSPFLFLICSEGLSSLMRTAQRRGLIKGAKATRQGPAASHLLFADDCILFGEASHKGAELLKDILQDYEICSGQCVNFLKSTVFFSPNTTEEDKAVVSRLLGVRVATNPEKYLGLPNMIGRRKKELFQNLLDKISMRIEGWSNRMLSQGERKGQERNSYAWRSIWVARGILEKGLIWKVGNGTDISIVNDAWVPDLVNSRLLSSYTGSFDNKVAELINCQTREWNREVVEYTFGADEADKILRIPLAKYPHDDLMAWRGEPAGDFSVKSTYKLLQSLDPSAYALQFSYFDFYKKLCAKLKVVKISKALSRWQHPPYQTVKINFDGAFDMKEHLSASGVVVRDNEGSVIVSKSRLHEKVASAFAAEALACRDAIQLGIDMQKEEVIIEGDSLTVIKKCRNVLPDRSQIGSYIFDIRQKKSDFKAIRFDFISRSVNTLAHMIATKTLKNKEEICLVGGVPLYAETQARNDSLREPD
ncbi:reverse transcriptase [Gossypium australe]|uniref:Reverse transcriptase n=1 Tax=Gossypium australe TaxID=47621 RepID=A0A5B6WPC4_9ROSI|nr:reverse transcriptase [Gossypium australe]